MSVSFKKTGNIIADGTANFNRLKDTPRSKNPTSYNAYQFNMSVNLEANKTYTIQFWDIDVNNTASYTQIAVYWGGGNSQLTAWTVQNGHIDYLVKTFTPTQSQASHADGSHLWLNIYNMPNQGHDTLTIGRWKLEEGSVPTVYTHGDDVSVGNSGFVEYNDITKIQKNGFMQSIEFNEY